MSKQMMGAFPELQAMAQAARAIGTDIAKTKDELERLILMIVKDKVVEKKKVKHRIKDDQGNDKEVEVEEEQERDATVEDMISATLILILQDEKFRRHVPDRMLQQLMLAATAVRDYERRKLESILPAIKARVRADLLTILHRAYPAWNSLVPNATNSMVDAMIYQRKKEADNSMLNMYKQQHSLEPPN